MSIPVELQSLGEAIAAYRFAYLLSSSPGKPPHAVAVVPVLEAGELVIDGTGRRTRENLRAQPQASLVWPPESVGDYSLIVDGQAVLDGDSLRIRPGRAVLHRPAPRPGPATTGGCGSDCQEIGLP